jgi:hypothetical protein
VARRVLAQIDTGNRTEAEKAAAKARKRTL